MVLFFICFGLPVFEAEHPNTLKAFAALLLHTHARFEAIDFKGPKP